MIVTSEQWQAVRAAIQETGVQFAKLVADTTTPDRNATLDWSVAETVAHVVTASALAVFVLRPDPAEHPFPTLQDRITTSNVDTVAELNELTLQQFTERDPQVLTGLLLENIDKILTITSKWEPATPVSWLGEAQVPVAGLLAHLLNEMLVHGRDIAGVAKSQWVIPPEQAAMFLELFMFGLAQLGYGKLLDHGVPAPSRRIAVQFRSKHTAPATLVLEGGLVSLAAPDRSDDVRVSFDPTVFILMMFGRVSKARAILTGKVSVSGRRPWLLPLFLRTMHLPGRGDPQAIAERRG